VLKRPNPLRVRVEPAFFGRRRLRRLGPVRINIDEGQPFKYAVALEAADWQALAGQAFLAEEALRAGLVFQASAQATAVAQPATRIQRAAAAELGVAVAQPAETSLAEQIVLESRFKRWAARSKVAQVASAETENAIVEGIAAEPSPAVYLPRLRRPTRLETAIEAPYRLILSPHRLAAWAHALTPVVSPQGRSELWHTRIAVWYDDQVYERPHYLRALRAIWALDPG